MPKIANTDHLGNYRKLTIKDYLSHERLNLATTKTPCHFGGYRTWFVCDCGKRVSVLYYHRKWACRHCVGLNYPSQHQSKHDRLNERINAIRHQLGWQRGVAHGHGTKPKRMKQATFNRLVTRHDELARQQYAIYTDLSKRLNQ